MEKQEILEKSRRENQKGDERERTIRMEGESFSLLFVFLMGLILLTWKRVHGLPHEDVLTMFWTACVANRVYRLARRRNASDIVTLRLSRALLIGSLGKVGQMAWVGVALGPGCAFEEGSGGGDWNGRAGAAGTGAVLRYRRDPDGTAVCHPRHCTAGERAGCL